MASTAERQAAYRESRGAAGENGERRISVWVKSGTWLALKRLARYHGVTQRTILERLIGAADNDITSSLHPDTRAWDAYMCSNDD
jgi:hypothetical protein